jgi:hypothetical protein
VKPSTLFIALFLCVPPLARAGDTPQKAEVSCVQANLGIRASMAGFHLDRCISTVDGKFILLTIDLKRVMANGNLYPGSAVRRMEFASMEAYAEMTCSPSEKKDTDRLWKGSECKWAKDQK